MRQIPRDAPGSAACGRSGLPLLAHCANGHRRTVPFRLLRTHDDDSSRLYARPVLCKACGNREVTLFAIESQTELTHCGGPCRIMTGQRRRRRTIGSATRTRTCRDRPASLVSGLLNVLDTHLLSLPSQERGQPRLRRLDDLSVKDLDEPVDRWKTKRIEYPFSMLVP